MLKLGHFPQTMSENLFPGIRPSFGLNLQGRSAAWPKAKREDARAVAGGCCMRKVLILGGIGILIAGHLVGPPVHPHAHIAMRVEREEHLIPQSTAPSASEADEEGAATAQPNPTASPLSPRPPGAAGPGRPASGWSGPGRPGPGRPERPRW